MKVVKKLAFWKKFSRYLTVGISVMIILSFFQTSPETLKAEDDDSCNDKYARMIVSPFECRKFIGDNYCSLPYGWLVDSSCPTSSSVYDGTPVISNPNTCSQQTTTTTRCNNSGQRCTYNIVINTNNVCFSTTENGPYNCYNDSSCQNQGSCSVYTDTTRRCFGGRLCRVDITYNSNGCGSQREGNNYSCQDDSSCGSGNRNESGSFGCVSATECSSTSSTSSTVSTVTRSSSSGNGVDVTQHNTQTQTNNQNVTVKFD